MRLTRTPSNLLLIMVLWAQRPPRFGPAFARTDSVGPGVQITDVQTPDD